MSDNFDREIWGRLSVDNSPTTLVQRRILPDAPHDVFIAESRPIRKRSMRLELDSELTLEIGSQPQGLGFSTSIETRPGKTLFVLEAASTNDNELFAELSNDLAGIIANSDPKSCADRLLSRVVSWQSFFTQARDPFSPARAAGLFSELTILTDSVLPHLGIAAGTFSWHGPDPALQDFQFPRFAIEVKSYRGTGPGVMRIGSEHQLEDIGVGNLFIAYLRLSQRAVGDGSTLGELIDDVRNQVTSVQPASDYFESQLLRVGWHDSFRPLRSEVYETRSLEFFEVKDGFPCIVSDMLPVGTHSVKYKIDRSALEPFLIEDNFMNDLIGRTDDV